MAEPKISQQVLEDFMATVAKNPNVDRQQLLQVFPEFGNDMKTLDAAFDYRATRLENPNADIATVNSKFPEFFGTPELAQAQPAVQTGVSGGSLLSEQEELARQNAIQGVTNDPNHPFVERESLRISDVQRPQDLEGEHSFYGLTDDELAKQIGGYEAQRKAAQDALRQQQRTRKRSFAERLAAIDNPSIQSAQDEIEIKNVRLSDADEDRYARLQQEKVWRERNSQSYQALGEDLLNMKQQVKNLEAKYGDKTIGSIGADAYLDKAIKLYQAPSKYGTQSGVKNWAEGLGNQLSDYDTWTLGVTEAFRAGDMASIVKKLNRNEELTDIESTKLQSFILLNLVEQERQKDLSTGYEIGKGTAESIPFMAEMLATAGLGAIGKKALIKAIVKSGNKTLANRVARAFGDELVGTTIRKAEQGVVEKIGRQIGGDVLMTAAMPTTWANINNDKATELLFGDQDYGFMDFMRSFTSATLETGTERWGGKIVDKTLNKVMPLDKIWGKQKWGKLLSNDFIHSPFGETGEEYINAIASAVRSVNPLYSDKSNEQLRAEAEHMFTPAGFAQTFLTVAPMSAFGGTANLSVAKYKLSQYNNGKAQLTGLLTGLGATTEQAENIIRQIESSEDTSGFAGKVAEIERILLNNYQVDHPNATKDEYEAFKKQVDKTVGAYFKGAAYLNELTGELRDAYAAMPEEDKQRCRDAWNEYVVAEFENKVPEESAQETTPLSPAAAEHQRAVDEVTQAVGERTHGNGYIYPVAMPGNAEKTGYIVGEVVPVIDESNPEQLKIENDDVVTVKWSDGTVTQERARDLDLTGAPMMDQQAIDIEVENQMYGYTQQRIQNGEQPVLMRNSEGILEGFFPTEEGLLEDQNGVQYTPEQLAEQGWQETKPVLFVNDTQQIAALDNGDGTYTQVDALGNPIAEPMSAEAFVEQGFAMVPLEEEQPKNQAPVEAPVEQAPEVQQPEVQEPAAPVVPHIETMSAEELGGSAVEYMGDKASAMAYLEAERDKADAEVRRTSKLKVTRFNGPEDFKRQNDQIQAAKRAAIDRYNKLQNAITAANAYKTLAEQKAEAERKAREAAMREQRRQLAEAETAGDIEAKWQNTKKTVGFTATKTLPNGQKVNGHYILTEAGNVVPSHDPRKNYADSEGYVMENGQNVNDNNYKDPDVQRIALDIAQNYGGQAVEQMPFLENRAGRVLSGNNRTISGIIAAENNTDQAYLAALAENAQQYGFTPEQLAEYEHPRLQFVVEDELPFTTATFAMFNQQEKKTKSSVNRAVANSKMVTEAVRDKMLEIMDQYESLDSFFSSESAAADIVQALITEGLMTQQEVAGLTENTGTGFKFGQSGREYVTDMLLGTLFDEQTIKMLAGEKTLKQAILRALPSIVANRRLKGYELTDSINNAIQLLYEARKANEGKSTADAFQLYLRQVDAFEGSVMDRYNGFDIILANRMSSGVEQLREILGLYNNSAMNEANGQMGFFEPRTIDDIKQDVYEYYTNQQPELAAALDGAAARGAQLESAVPGGVADAPETRQEGIESEQAQEDAETNEPKVWTEQELSSKILSEKEKEELLNRIKDDKTPVVVVHNADFAQVLAAEVAPKSIQDQINRYIASGVSLNGVSYNDKEFVNFDAVQTGIDVIKAYVHERQHLFTKADPAYKDVVKANATAGELHGVVKAISNSDAYDIYLKMGKYGQDVLADEFISHIMQEVYALGAEADNLAQIYGINNTEILKTLKTLDDEQRNDANLSKARRNALVGSSDQGTSGQNERNSQPGSERDLGRQGLRPAGSSNQRTGIGAEQVTPFEKTRLGLVAAEFRRQYPDKNVGILFREKDTYEFYDKDAVRAAEILGLQTTEKDGVPFLSFPLEKLQDYLGKLVRGGMKIGITHKPDHKPTKGDYQIGDSLTYNGKTATIQDFTYFGTAILDVEGRRVEVSREQLDDILDYGDYMYHVGDVVKYKGKRAQIVEFASGEPVIEVEGESEKRYVSFSDIERVKKETPTDNREASGTNAAEVEIGGALVDRLGDMGVDVSTDLDANRAALKAAKADKSDAGAIHYYKTPSGQQYGFSYKGRIYLDPTKIDAELPIHEYGHLWAEAMRRISPESWRSVVDTIKADQASWDFVRELRPELTDENEIAEEVIATFSGKRGAERLRAEYNKMHGKDADYKSKWGNIFQNISKAIQDFWKAVGDFLNIKYQSAEQIYDQVLKDFVENMNPYQKVRDFLRARDAEYIQAAESGDIQKATNIFYDALRENIGNGITPYMSVGTYLQFKRLAKGVKTRDAAIIREAAEKIAPLIPDNAVLVPTPSHTGRATDMLDLANAIAEITGSEVADILRSAPRESQYQAKKETGTPIASQQLGIMMEGTVPADKTAIVIDNVVDSGNTAEACIQALGKGVVVTLADSAEQYRHAASLRSAAPILRDKDGNIVPLTKRFNLNGSRYLGRRMYLRPNDPRFSISGTQVIPVGEKTLVGLHNISAEKLRKAIKMGGLANPSTAVINIASQNHEQYGDISLIMPSSLVDSKTGRNAGTFTGDIWSPTYPHVEKQMSDKGDDAYYAAITKAFGNNEARRPILSRAKLDFDDYLDSGNIRAGLAYWYLLEKGIEPGDVYFNSGISDDIKERFRPLYDKGILDLTKEDYRTLLSLIAEQQGKTAEDMLQDAQESKARYQQTIDDPEAKQFYKKIAQQAIDEIDLYGVRYNVLSNGYHAMKRAVRDDGKIDLTSTLIAAQDIVQTQYQADFDKWLSDMDKRFDIKEVLLEDYDRDGNRIYKPHTLANASRMMNKEDLQNAGDHSGLGATRGQLVERMETLADIRAEKGRLRPGAEEDFETEEWNKMQDEWFNKVLNPLSEMQKISDNPFSNVGYAETHLQEALRTKDPIATLNKEYGYKIDPNGEWAKNLRDMVQRVKDLPTKYFETKFRRPVYLDEFANAVVPVGLPQDLRAGLESAGLRLFSYDPNAQGSRRDATLEATAGEGIRFSISSAKGSPSVARRGNLQYSEGVLPSVAKEMESIKNEAVNNGTFMQAPNGKPTNLDERQWLQVRLRSFKRWFGDWQNDPEHASKVVDENGEPMVVYHGRSPIATFTEFRPSPFGSLGAGIYFAPDRSSAEAYSRRYGGEYGKENVIEAFLNMRNPLYTKGQFLSDAERAELENHDGVIFQYYGDIIEINAHAPNQIKSATDNDGSFSEENDDIRFAISNQNNDIFYSNAERAVESIKQDKATPEQWRAMIEKAGGLKAGEDKWIGLSDWLAQQRPTVTPQGDETRSQFVERAAEENKRFTLSKQELLDYIREHKIQIEETEYGDVSGSDEFKRLENEFSELCWNIDDVYTQRWVEENNEVEKFYDEMQKKYGDEYLDSLSPDEQRTENYLLDAREVYNKENPDYDDAFQEMVRRYGDDFEMAFWHEGARLFANDNSAAAYYADEANAINDTRLKYTTEGLENKREIALTVPTIESWNEYDDIHFGDAGEGRAIAWVRFGDATDEQGNKTLVIDEIQSKRHQEGREKGYVDSEQAKKYDQLRKDFQEAEKEYHDYRAALWNKYKDAYATRGEMLSELPEDENTKLTELRERYERLSDEWGELRDDSPANAIPAAPFEKNWHELAMKRILRFAAENGYDKVAWTTGDQQARRYDIGNEIESITKEDDFSFYIETKDGSPSMDLEFDEDGIYRDEDDRQLNGKSMSEVFGKELAKRLQELPSGETLSDEGLRLGGEGMRGFYDDILPRFMQKYGKKWGVQVGEVTMPQLEDGYQTMHSIDITDAMRESVLEGQPMFSISGRGVNGTMKPQEGETRSQYIARVAETVKNMTPRNTTIDDAIRFSITVNHNSPYLLKRADGSFVDPETGERLGFDHRFMGKGEGNQAHGWGSYFAANDIREYANNGDVNNVEIIRDIFNASKWKKEALYVANFYILKAQEQSRSSFKKFLEDELSHRESLLKRYKEAEPLKGIRGVVQQESIEKTQEEVNNLTYLLEDLQKDMDMRMRHHYTVEIPDNTGGNYLEEGKMQVRALRKLIKVMTDEQKERLLEIPVARYAHNNEEIMPRTFDFLEDRIRYNTPDSWRDVYEVARVAAMSDKGASELLSKAGFVGIHYDGRRDGECYVIFDENDAKITDHIRFAISGRGKNVDDGNLQASQGRIGEIDSEEFFDSHIRFSVRKEPAPKKTGIGYKVFYRGKDGKLYPPMVANPNGEDTPVGVWLNADAAPVAGESKTGRPQVKAGGKGTKGGSGQLAYRPGWHLGEIPYALQFNRKDEKGEKTLFPKDFVWAEVEYAADNDYQEEAMKEGMNASGKFQHSLAGLKHVPTDGFYRYRTNPNPETDPWIITGAMKVNRVLTNEEVDEIVRAAGREPQRREGDERRWKTVAEVDEELQENGYSDESPIRFSVAYHGTGADFDKFLKSKINTGEGSQAFGWGLYFTDAKEIAEDYAKRQARMQRNVKDAYLGEQKLNPVAPESDLDCLAWVLDMNELRNIRTMNPDVARSIVKNTIALKTQELKDRIKFYEGNGATRMVDSAREELEYYRRAGELVRETGIPNIEFRGDRNLYTVSIPEDDGMNYFEWNADIDDRLKQSIIDGIVRRMEQMPEYGNTPGYAARIVPDFMRPYHVGGVVYQVGTRWLPKEEMSEVLAELGYKGIKYDAGTNFSQGVPDGAKNYVVFDDKDIEITEHIRFSISGSDTMKPQADETRKQYIERVAAAVKRMTPRSATIDDTIRFSITVNHNSPYLLKKADGSFVDPETGERLGFDHRFMGKGKGGQAHGWGTYLSVNDLRKYAERGGIVNDVYYKGKHFDYLSNWDEEDFPAEAARVMAWFTTSGFTNGIDVSTKQGMHDALDNAIRYYRRRLEDPQDRAMNGSTFEKTIEVIKELHALVDQYGDDIMVVRAEKHHYVAEIPDDDGTNYLDELKTLPKPLRRKIAAAVRELPGKPMPSVKYVNYTGGWRQLADMIERNQWAYMEIRDRLVQAFGSKLTDEKRLSNMMHDIGFVGIHYDGRRDGECYVIFDENDAVITDHIRFAISGNGKAPSSAVTEALVKQANDSFRLMQSALKKVSADLRTINAIRTQQFEYDRKVVDMLLDLYNSLLQENSVWAGYMPDTTRRIATQIVHAIGKKDISAEVNTIMDHMVHAQAKAAQRQWDKLRTKPVDKINISGVVMQGKVALQGQHALKAMNEALDGKMSIAQLEDLISKLMDMEDNATDESLKLQYKGQWIGYTIAAQHLERIEHLKEERNQLDLELQEARSNRAIKPSARQQLVANIQQAMRDNYIAQADAYAQSAKDLAEYVTTQEGQAKDFIHRQDANRDKIRSYAQRDLEGLSTNPNRNRTRGNIVRQIWDAFASPIRDLQSLLRLTGMHAPDGEGYLYNHFMRGWMDGADKERLGIVNASKTLDAKINELTHGKYKTWEEAARKIDDASHKMFTITMLNGVDGKDMPVEEEIPLNTGNALYIYAVNKMTDGRMKLAGMNITEEDVKALADQVREQFGQEILDVVDWVQSEYFSQLRNRYNPTHEALFGAPMDAIENYFPLRINAAARQQNEDLSEPDTDAARLLAGTSTGAIKRRTKNSLPLDVRNADFFQEVIRHIAQMERWNAFAQWNRDANILFSDINFRNRIKGMNGTIYGSGDKLYNYMKDAFRVAIGTYKPKTDTFSEITLNVAKGVTSAKINFRVWTAMKQIASFPAFFTYMQDGTFVGSYLRNWLKPHETMKWAKENLPNFEKRVSKRDMGDMRLMQRSTDWQWNKRILELSSKYGMYFNVYFDTLTCATGARAVYDSRLAEYLKKGYPQEQAEQRARQDAEQAFNTSQQSSEGAFMSAVQMDRNLVTAALTVFRTSPIQYTRNFMFHTRNLLRKFGRGSKEEQITFRMGQYKNDGLNDEQARKAAEKDYNKSIRADVVGFVVYGALLNLLWRLVGQVPYLLFGDDDDKKKQILEDATSGGAWFSPFTGLLGGGIVESALDGNGSVADMFAPEMPFTQDVKRAGQYLENDKYAEFANQALSVAMQSGTGFDPQTAADMVQRVVTTIDSEEELSAAEEAIRISQALLSVPQSQYEQQLVDRVVADDSEYDAALADYIRYQKVHTAPLTWWLRSEESDEKAEENAEKRFDRLLNERDALHNPADYEE